MRSRADRCLSLVLSTMALGSVLLVLTSALAEEGMWTLDNLPLKFLQERYGFTPTREWLEHVRLSSVRFNDGGSGSFVSPHGLTLTNHQYLRHDGWELRLASYQPQRGTGRPAFRRQHREPGGRFGL